MYIIKSPSGQYMSTGGQYVSSSGFMENHPCLLTIEALLGALPQKNLLLMWSSG
jgi:hypothetical protein